MIDNLEIEGFQIINNIYSPEEIATILDYIQTNDIEKKIGIRAFLVKHPTLLPLLLNHNLQNVIHSLSKKAQIIKSIYFDKPPNANWVVNWHQDLTLNLKAKRICEGFKNWRVLKDRVVVQPPINILENIFTIRIHLDPCTKENGALRLIKKSHTQGVIDVRNGIDSYQENEIITEITTGGILIMRPLILHASRRTENDKNRRVIHIEFSDIKLPCDLEWWEKIILNLE